MTMQPDPAESATESATESGPTTSLAVSDHALLDAVRAHLDEEYPHRTVVGVLFRPEVADDNGSSLGIDGTVLFAGGTVDAVFFGEDLAATFQQRWPNVDRLFTAVLDLRLDTLTIVHTDRGIYDCLNFTRPA